MTYPLNITGVAPWAIKIHPVDPVSFGSRVPVPKSLGAGSAVDPGKAVGSGIGAGTGIGIGIGQRSSDSSRSGRISVPVPSSFMTVMPRHEMTKGPMTGAFGRPGVTGTTGVPPLAHTHPSPNPVLLFIPAMKKEVESSYDNHSKSESGCDGYARLLEYMEKCLPSVKGCVKNTHWEGSGTGLGLQQRRRDGQKEGEVEGQGQGEEEEEGEGDDWRAAQAASTPTLLPTLRFHELVFGQELGKGSFGCVKYARMIIRGKPRSEWPEYAIKIISKDTVTKCEYGSAVIREMAVLQMVSHPGFARLISLFRYTHSAYLVLEYAGRGDLHSMVIRRGPKRKGQSPISLPLSHLCTRFILSEVVTALLSIHSIGLSYNDLKPENILITEMGHIKITDFGGCRAFTNSAKESLQERCKDLSDSESLRNGDWRDTPAEERGENERGPLFGSNLLNFEDDDRFDYKYYVV